jgi:hypothetical protein
MRPVSGAEYSPLRISCFGGVSSIGLSVFIVLWTASLMLVNTEWYYLPTLLVDPAVYLGWSLNPFLYRAIYSSYPGGDLIPLIFPNALFYRLLSPLNANLAIKFISFALCNLSVVFLMRKLFNLPTALFCLIYFSTYRYTLMAIGSDYTDGRVILYFLLGASFALGAAMYRATRAIHSRATRWALFFIAGLFAQMMVSTAVLSVTLLPFILGLSAVTLTWNTGKQFVFTTMAQLAPIVMGFFAGAGLLSLVNATIYGGTGFYAHNTIHKLLYVLGENRVSITDWHVIRSWLMVPLAIVSLGIACSLWLIKNNEHYLVTTAKGMALGVLVLAGVTTFLGYTVLQFAFHQETLSNPTYFNFVTPLVFLFAGALFFCLLEPLHRSTVFMVFLAYSGLSICLLSLFRYGGPSDFKIALGCVCLALLWVIYYRYDKASTKIAALCFLLIAVNYMSATPRFPTQFSSVGRKANFLTVVEWVDLCNRLDKFRKAYVWYNLKEPPGAAFLEMSSASHMWRSGGVINEEFPQINDEELARITSNIHIDGKANIFLFSQKDDAENIVVARLHDRNLKAVLLERKQLIWKDMPFIVYLFRVQQESRD